jgi:hypothetical protein
VKFWASAEVFVVAFQAQDKVRRNVERFLNAALAKSSLVSVDCEIRYIPIIMPEDMRARYPARSKLLKPERIYDCAPQLEYEVFVDGTFEDQLREYFRGIAESVPHLFELGATSHQIEDFKTILESAVDHILAGEPSQILH